METTLLQTSKHFSFK